MTPIYQLVKKEHKKVANLKTKILESNISIDYKDQKIDTKQTKILILSLVNNCGHTIHYITNFIQNISNIFPLSKFCFFTNNNVDKTNDILLNLFTNLKTVHIIHYKNEKITTENRIHKFAEYRNKNFEYAIEYFGTDFDYVIVFDSDLGSDIPVEPIVDSFNIDQDWSCISGNHCYKNSSYYYDQLALRLIEDPIDVTLQKPKFLEFYGKSEEWIEKLLVIDDWLSVKAAFGGISIYKMQELLDIFHKNKKLYDISDLPQYSAEHMSLNLRLKCLTLINPNIKYTNNSNIEGRMYNKPIAFIPRDAGFFSVFNFLVGCLTMGTRIYPYFNKEQFLSMNNGVNEHFCYWTNSENCWFDYFEPLKFFDDDNCHLTDEYKTFNKHRGEVAPVEFRIPKDTHNLINDIDRFKKWRQDTHKFYTKHIKYKPEILDKVNIFWNSALEKDTKVIGVHYRHPSHFIESGKVYLEQYFEKIDEILSRQPESKIFLATDTNFGIYAFMERYDKKIQYIKNVDRLTMPEFLEWSFNLAGGKADHVGFINGKGFELHHKRIGSTENKQMTIDLLTEVLCLSRCDYLIHTTSNVALSISYINPDLELISL
jgi:hypothetical protein